MMEIKAHSGVYSLQTELWLPIPVDKAWGFFSHPGNLALITPSYMKFRITSGFQDKIYPGQMITYKVGILPGISSSWVTEISEVADRKYFIDEQRSGPFSLWHHEHHFAEEQNGTRIIDKLTYKIPLGILGKLAQVLFVKKQIVSIFTYRTEKLQEMFGR